MRDRTGDAGSAVAHVGSETRWCPRRRALALPDEAPRLGGWSRDLPRAQAAALALAQDSARELRPARSAPLAGRRRGARHAVPVRSCRAGALPCCLHAAQCPRALGLPLRVRVAYQHPARAPPDRLTPGGRSFFWYIDRIPIGCYDTEEPGIPSLSPNGGKPGQPYAASIKNKARGQPPARLMALP